MRWRSCFAILFYISLLCIPQAIAVHDVRLSPLADTQLQALLPSLPAHTIDNTQNNDNDPPALISTAAPNVVRLASRNIVTYVSVFVAFCVPRQHRVRAPPHFFSQ